MFFLVRLLEFFDGDVDFGFDVPTLEYYPICSLPNGRENLVFLH